MSAWEYDAKKRAEDRRIGRMIARAKARGETMVDLSRVYDFRCMQGVGTLITERKQRVWPMSEDVAVHPMEARRLRLADLAEYRYWRELESLTGQRDKFRPGVEDTLCSDDELAGVAA